MNKELVVHSNTLLKSVGSLSTQELKLLLYCVTRVRRDGGCGEDNRHFEISHSDFVGVTNKDNCYVSMRAAARKLRSRSITFHNVIDADGTQWDGCEINMIAQQKWKDGEGMVRISFTPEFMPLLIKLKSDYTKYLFADIGKLESHYAIILHGILRNHMNIQKSHKSNKNLLISVGELRDVFNLGVKYPIHADFRRNVIEKSVYEINELTPLTVRYSQLKKGRRIDAYSFKVDEKAKALSASSKSQRKIEKTIESIKKALVNGRIVSINSKRLIDLTGAIASFESGAENMYLLLKNDAEVEIKQAEELF